MIRIPTTYEIDQLEKRGSIPDMMAMIRSMTATLDHVQTIAERYEGTDGAYKEGYSRILEILT